MICLADVTMDDTPVDPIQRASATGPKRSDGLCPLRRRKPFRSNGGGQEPRPIGVNQRRKSRLTSPQKQRG